MEATISTITLNVRLLRQATSGTTHIGCRASQKIAIAA
jgi:hypothetical protein